MPKFSPKLAPKFAPKFFGLSWRVEKSSPKCHQVFPSEILISRRSPNQISPKISQTHFCRLGSPNKSSLKEERWVILTLGQKVGPGVGFPAKEKMKTYFRTYFLGDKIQGPSWVRSGPAWHRVSRALRARNPGRVRKESRKSPPGGTPRVPEESATESQKSPKRLRKSGFGLFSDSFETPGRTLRGLWAFRAGDSFGTLFGLFRGSVPEGPGRPCAGRGRS